MYDVIIVGAGTAGLASAVYTAMNNQNLKIMLLEKESKCGRKLSASGNGKCNITNSEWSFDCYSSDNEAFIDDFVSKHNPSEIIRFFELLGIPLYEKNGYYYPFSNMAKQVTSILIDELDRRKVSIVCDAKVTRIRHDENNKHYYVYANNMGNKPIEAKNVILALGSNASPKLGGSNTLDIIKKLEIGTVPFMPSLCPIYVEDDLLKLAKGVRVDGKVNICVGKKIYSESGQVQFNDNNLSGIALMNLSKYVYELKGDEFKDALFIELLPEYSWDKLKEYIICTINIFMKRSVINMLDGFLPHQLSVYILRRLKFEEDMRIGDLSDKQINRLTSCIKMLNFTPKLYEDYDKAQVSLGGVKVKEIDADTFESRKYPGLYIVGEVLDMTGKCGGYNISFAILSAIAASRNILGDL
ncbi:MAG: aminoacetone oxidase family FAD-binding enzyme [Lachnospiraceae bacterium]|jgi:hypothetical protein|nr:aminoacetone oxidase family FAD-binding enzyme [Lachnospiraceae bacterium]